MTTFAHKWMLALAAITLVCSVCHAQHSAQIHRTTSPRTAAADNRLLGFWKPEGISKPVLYLRDGTGKNPDGSRFKWRLEGRYLVAQALSSEGKPVGSTARIPLVFTRDGKEYATFLEAGKLKTPFYRLLANGRVDKHQSKSGGTYPPHDFAPKQPDDDEGPPPAVVRPETAPHKSPNTFGPPRKAADPQPSGSSAPQTAPAPRHHAIHVGSNIHVSAALPRAPHNEVTIAAHPIDPNCLLAASMFEAPGHPNIAKIVIYASFDGGKTWAVSLRRSNADPQSYADPTFAYGPDGTVHFADMYFPTPELAPPDKGACLEFTHSTDGGKTWSATTQIEGWHDRPFLAVDNTDGMRRGWLYCSVGAPDRRMFVSKDEAASFSPSPPYSLVPGTQLLSGNPVVAADGSLVHLYASLPGKATTTADADILAPGARSEATQIGAIEIARSVDGGTSFLPSQKIASFQSSNVKPGGLPMLATTPGSARFRSHVYAVWADMQAGGTCIRLAVSKDNGATWSRPILLSEQTGKERFEAFLPSAAVNKEGIVGVSWYDTRAIPIDQAGWDMRFRISRDGGDTWLPSIRVNDFSTLNQKKPRKRPHPENRFNNIQPGHTAGLAADAAGLFHPLWIDGRTGIRQVFTSAISVDIAR